MPKNASWNRDMWTALRDFAAGIEDRPTAASAAKELGRRQRQGQEP